MVEKRGRGRPTGTTKEVSEFRKYLNGITGLTGSEICDIIKTCGEQQVSTFQLGPLNVNFVAEPEPTNTIQVMQRQGADHIPESSSNGEDHEGLTEDDLAYMQVNDPVAYEALALDEGMKLNEDSDSSRS